MNRKLILKVSDLFHFEPICRNVCPTQTPLSLSVSWWRASGSAAMRHPSDCHWLLSSLSQSARWGRLPSPPGTPAVCAIYSTHWRRNDMAGLFPRRYDWPWHVKMDPKLNQIGPKLEISVDLKISFSTFGSKMCRFIKFNTNLFLFGTMSQNLLKLILKGPKFVPFGANMTHFVASFVIRV